MVLEELEKLKEALLDALDRACGDDERTALTLTLLDVGDSIAEPTGCSPIQKYADSEGIRL